MERPIRSPSQFRRSHRRERNVPQHGVHSQICGGDRPRIRGPKGECADLCHLRSRTRPDRLDGGLRRYGLRTLRRLSRHGRTPQPDFECCVVGHLQPPPFGKRGDSLSSRIRSSMRRRYVDRSGGMRIHSRWSNGLRPICLARRCWCTRHRGAGRCRRSVGVEPGLEEGAGGLHTRAVPASLSPQWLLVAATDE